MTTINRLLPKLIGSGFRVQDSKVITDCCHSFFLKAVPPELTETHPKGDRLPRNEPTGIKWEKGSRDRPYFVDKRTKMNISTQVFNSRADDSIPNP